MNSDLFADLFICLLVGIGIVWIVQSIAFMFGPSLVEDEREMMMRQLEEMYEPETLRFDESDGNFIERRDWP